MPSGEFRGNCHLPPVRGSGKLPVRLKFAEVFLAFLYLPEFILKPLVNDPRPATSACRSVCSLLSFYNRLTMWLFMLLVALVSGSYIQFHVALSAASHSPSASPSSSSLPSLTRCALSRSLSLSLNLCSLALSLHLCSSGPERRFFMFSADKANWPLVAQVQRTPACLRTDGGKLLPGMPSGHVLRFPQR